MIEIRWHGRAGQGAKTASQLYAEAALRAGHYVQAFPEYGPERSGAPMRAFNRLDDRPIRRRYGVTEPDAVVILDESLVNNPLVAEGVTPDTAVLLNCSAPPDDLALPGRIIPIAGDAIAAEHGLRHPNVVMMGALAAAVGEPPLEELEACAAELFAKKLGAGATTPIVQAIRTGHAAARCREPSHG
jgi:pyruvate ferredoxin oxidoreductase gamma subunit